MYDNNTHSVPDRIVRISQPYIRPIVRGKAKSPTEFGAKLDASIDEKEMARIERLSFDAYNESDVLIYAIKNYKQRTGHYTERVLVDKIYRNRINRDFCKKKESECRDLHLADQNRRIYQTKSRSTGIMLTA